jgi:hypothetical protein
MSLDKQLKAFQRRFVKDTLKGLPILLSESAGDYSSKELVNRDVEQLGN